MISSRCNDPVQLDGKEVTLTALRKQLRRELEGETLLGSPIFDVWINELAPSAEGTLDSWETCLREIELADIVLCLYNGNAGWAPKDSEIGICHAELDKALSTAAAKVRLIKLPDVGSRSGPDNERDVRFRDYVARRNLFRRAAGDGNEAIALCKEALREAVAEMTHLGVREARRGKFHSGDALDWSRLSFDARRDVMRRTLCNALSERDKLPDVADHPCITIDGRAVLARCHAIPASVAAPGALDPARQPFLTDHLLAAHLSSTVVGPIHFIACHQSATEAQAIKQLGFADALVVSPPFGVYVADNIQKIQLIFIKGCRDATSTRHGVQRVFEWLGQTGEDRLLADRAAARARITQAIAQEMARPT